jgi:hypothetical protein
MLFLSLFFLGYGYYYQNDMGGSSLGIGGAPIGLNNSVECGLYNPAAFERVEKLNLFAGYKLTRGDFSYVVVPDDTSRSDYAFPDYLGVALPFGSDFFLGISLSVPYRAVEKNLVTFTRIDESDPRGFVESPGAYIQSERFYFLNTAVGKAINDRFSVGLNMGMFWNRYRVSQEADDPGFDNAFFTIDKYGIEPCLGLTFKASDMLNFGLIVKKGFAEAYRRSLPDTTYAIESDEGLPLVIGFGTGINLRDKLYLNASAEYVHWTLAYCEDHLYSDDYRNVIRLHLGAQYRLNDLLFLSTGFYTDPSPINFVTPYTGSHDQIFLTGGIGLDFGRVALNLSAASSALIKMDPSLREENHFNLSVVYR